jgi:hypothetical protein
MTVPAKDAERFIVGDMIDIEHRGYDWKVLKVKRHVETTELTLRAADGCPHNLALALHSVGGKWRRAQGHFTLESSRVLHPDQYITVLQIHGSSGMAITLADARAACAKHDKCRFVTYQQDGSGLRDSTQGVKTLKMHFTFYSKLREQMNPRFSNNQHNRHIMTKMDWQDAACIDTSGDVCMAKVKSMGNNGNNAEMEFKQFMVCQLDLLGDITANDISTWANTNNQKWLKKLQKAFRKVSLNHHPDKQMGKSKTDRDTAALLYQEISSAYDMLSDDVKSQRLSTQQNQALNKHRTAFRDRWNKFTERSAQKDLYTDSTSITR